jgi:cation/acetate symporter
MRRKQSSEREELWAFRLAAVALAAVGIAIAILFQKENIAFLNSLAFAVAASANFPLLMLVLYWRRLTVAGALAGGITGMITSLAFIIMSPAVWVRTLGNETALFPADYPTLVTAPLAFLVCILVSLATAKAASRPAAVAAE